MGTNLLNLIVSSTPWRTCARFGSAKADMFLTESLQSAGGISQWGIDTHPLRLICYPSSIEDGGHPLLRYKSTKKLQAPPKLLLVYWTEDNLIRIY